MRAAIYARYSSDLQSEASIEDQIRLCREYAERNSNVVFTVYTDYAISGGSLSNRPGMLGLLEDAKQGKFDLLIAEALDRISRDQEDTAAIFKRLSHVNVAIFTMAEGEINELHIGTFGYFKNFECFIVHLNTFLPFQSRRMSAMIAGRVRVT